MAAKTPKRTGLGRGIGSLIPTANNAVDVFFQTPEASGLVPVPGAELVQIDPNLIKPNAKQPRTEFRQEELDELVHSVREFGVLQPIVVRRSEVIDGVQNYELIMGERRFRASKLAGLKAIPAVIRETNDSDMLRDALLENLHRANLNPLEEASAYKQLMDDFGTTQEQLADKIGRSRSQIANTLRLLKLPEKVQAKVASGVLSFGHAKAILATGGAVEQERLANKIVNEGLTVRDVEALVSSSPEAKKTKPRAGARQDHLKELAVKLGDHLETRAQISLGAKKGQISIDFATFEDLNRILGVIGIDPKI